MIPTLFQLSAGSAVEFKRPSATTPCCRLAWDGRLPLPFCWPLPSPAPTNTSHGNVPLVPTMKAMPISTKILLPLLPLALLLSRPLPTNSSLVGWLIPKNLKSIGTYGLIALASLWARMMIRHPTLLCRRYLVLISMPPLPPLTSTLYLHLASRL